MDIIRLEHKPFKSKKELYIMSSKIEDKEYLTKCGCMEEKTNYGLLIYHPRHEDNISCSINSCCGGCVSANDLKYCCYCGKKLEFKEKEVKKDV